MCKIPLAGAGGVAVERGNSLPPFCQVRGLESANKNAVEERREGLFVGAPPGVFS